MITSTPVKEDKECRCGKALFTVHKEGEDESLNGRFTAHDAHDGKSLTFDMKSLRLLPKLATFLTVHKKEGTDKWSRK